MTLWQPIDNKVYLLQTADINVELEIACMWLCCNPWVIRGLKIWDCRTLACCNAQCVKRSTFVVVVCMCVYNVCVRACMCVYNLRLSLTTKEPTEDDLLFFQQSYSVYIYYAFLFLLQGKTSIILRFLDRYDFMCVDYAVYLY